MKLKKKIFFFSFFLCTSFFFFSFFVFLISFQMNSLTNWLPTSLNSISKLTLCNAPSLTQFTSIHNRLSVLWWNKSSHYYSSLPSQSEEGPSQSKESQKDSEKGSSSQKKLNKSKIVFRFLGWSIPSFL